MGLFDALWRRRGSGARAARSRGSHTAETEHLDVWAASRYGVEAYVEPQTAVTETTVVLVAHDGEWTRRRIGSLATAQQFGKKRTIPVYEVRKTGYPQRMRDYTERQRILRRRHREEHDLGG